MTAMSPEQVEALVAVMDQTAARFIRGRSDRDLDDSLREIVDAAVAAVPGVTHAGITTLESDGRLCSAAWSGEVVARLDQAQAVLREGPCMTALAEHLDSATAASASSTDQPVPADEAGNGEQGGSVVLVNDMAIETQADGRWPRFAPEALRNGVGSMLSMHLSGGRRPARALNLYADQPAVFDLATRAVAALFADQAAIALYGAEQVAGLNQAVATRDVIGQAKGILIERHHLAGDDEAFAMLVEASQHTNLKLRDIAEWLVTDTIVGHEARRAEASSDSPVRRER